MIRLTNDDFVVTIVNPPQYAIDHATKIGSPIPSEYADVRLVDYDYGRNDDNAFACDKDIADLFHKSTGFGKSIVTLTKEYLEALMQGLSIVKTTHQGEYTLEIRLEGD